MNSRFMISGIWLQNDVNKKMINIEAVESFEIECVNRLKEDDSHQVVVNYFSDSPPDVIYVGSEENCEKVRDSLWEDFTNNHTLASQAMQSMVDLSGLIWRLINILHPNEEESDGEEEQSQSA